MLCPSDAESNIMRTIAFAPIRVAFCDMDASDLEWVAIEPLYAVAEIIVDVAGGARWLSAEGVQDTGSGQAAGGGRGAGGGRSVGGRWAVGGRSEGG